MLKPRLAAGLTLLICLISGSASAQTKTRLSILAGMNLSKAAYDDQGFLGTGNFDNKFRVGYGFGLDLSIPLAGSQSFNLVPGLFLQARGGKTEFTGPLTDETGPDPIGTQTVESTLKLTYMTVPLTARILFGQGKNRPFIQFGSELGIRIAASLDGEDIKADIRSTDVALIVGGGVELPFNQKTAILQLLYVHGLSDVLDARNAVFDVKLKSRVLSLMIGIGF